MAEIYRVIRQEAIGSIVYEVTVAGVNNISMTVSRSASTVARWIKAARKTHRPRGRSSPPKVVGLEVACRPNGSIALLQLCVGNRCLIYQLPLSDTRPPDNLFEFLDNHRFCFFGHGVDVITYRLQREYRFSVRNTSDIGDTAADRLGREDLRQAGLEWLGREVIHLEVEKPDEVRRSAWWQHQLSDEQIVYACADAYMASELGKVLSG